MISIIGLILSLSLIIFLAYKDYSTIITAPLVSLLTVLLIGGDSSRYLMVHYTEVYMSGFGGFGTLPHNGAVITTLAICGLTHKDSYKDIFVTSVIIPILVTTLIVIATSIYYI